LLLDRSAMVKLLLKCLCSAALVALGVSALVGAQRCGSFRDSRGRSSIDVAPLEGYTELCSQDFQLCVMLTLGYPPSVQTIGYFVRDEEWQQCKEGKHERCRFNRYLIAQRGRDLSDEEFLEFKRYIHSNQGNVMDHTESARAFELENRMSLGVIDENRDSISFGVILKTKAPDEQKSRLIASINTALQLKGESLSLYVFDAIKDLKDTDRIKSLADEWLKCIRDRNK
jgi:hypothetical protein